jgi:hypothetical protein
VSLEGCRPCLGCGIGRFFSLWSIFQNNLIRNKSYELLKNVIPFKINILIDTAPQVAKGAVSYSKGK